MGCCGDRRRALQAGSSDTKSKIDALSQREQTSRRLAFLGKAAISIYGPRSGLAYTFYGDRQGVPVDERDVPALLATGKFVVVQHNDPNVSVWEESPSSRMQLGRRQGSLA